MIGAVFTSLWLRLVLAVVPAVLTAAVLSRGRPARGGNVRHGYRSSSA